MLKGRFETNQAHGHCFDSLGVIHKHLSIESLYERYPVEDTWINLTKTLRRAGSE